MRVVITSVGSLVGKSILDSLEARRSSLEIIGTNSIADAAGNFRCDRTYLVPPASSQAAYETRLIEIVSSERPRLVLPGRDDDIAALARIKQRVEAVGASVPVGPVPLALVLEDKWATSQFAVEHALPFAESARAEVVEEVDALVRRHGYPVITKPRRGHGSRGVHIVFNEAQLAATRRKHDLLVQAYLQPEPELTAWSALCEAGVPLFHAPSLIHIACQGVIGPDGRLRGVVCVQSRHVMGELAGMHRLESAEAVDAFERWAVTLAQLGWVGPLNLQGRFGEGGRFLGFELNGRFTGATAARALLGFDEVRMVLEAFTGHVIAPWPEKPAAVVHTAFSCFGISQSGAQRLEADGVWSRT